MTGFSAKDVVESAGSKYQQAGVSEKVTITELVLVEGVNGNSLQFKTINEKEQIGQSKRLSLKNEVSIGKTVSAWTVSAKYLLNLLKAATGMTHE